MFKKNEGATDRWIRGIVGVVVMGVAYLKLTGGIQTGGYVVGIVLIFTAIVGFCGLYKILGISTLDDEK